MSNPASQLAPFGKADPIRRLLLITYHFPPDGAVGGLRWAGLSKYLARLGWEVHVITAAGGDDLPATPGVHRHVRAPGATLNSLYVKAVSVRRPRTHDSEPAISQTGAVTAPRAGAFGRLFARVRKGARIALAFPDSGRGWVLRAATTARALMREQRFDAIVTSGPPHSAHFAGVLAALGQRVPHILDMRDPWRGANRDFPAYGMDPNWMFPLIGVLEWLLFHRVRDVVANTREFAENLQKAQPQLTVWHVSNGTDIESLPVRTEERFEGLSLAYLGTFYAGRSFSTVVAALRSLSRSRPREASTIKLRIAGNMDALQREQLQAELDAEGLSDRVEFRGRVPRAEALQLLVRSDVALVLAQAQPTQVPAKLYECVGLGVPTVAITEMDSATAREARRIGAMVVESGDADGMRRVLDDLIDARLPKTIVPAAPIAYEALAQQINRVLEGALRPVRRV